MSDTITTEQQIERPAARLLRMERNRADRAVLQITEGIDETERRLTLLRADLDDAIERRDDIDALLQEVSA